MHRAKENLCYFDREACLTNLMVVLWYLLLHSWSYNLVAFTMASNKTLGTCKKQLSAVCSNSKIMNVLIMNALS